MAKSKTEQKHGAVSQSDTYDGYSYGYGYGYGGYNYSSCSYPAQPAVDFTVALSPLIEQLRVYDELRTRLQRQGGGLADLRQLAQALNHRLMCRSPYGESYASLSDQPALRALLVDVGGYRLHLQVRQLNIRMPVYYLCRLHRDYWAEYGLIVEDLYLSPGYPLTDDRFAKLMDAGHETFFLRLSPFRQGVSALFADDSTRPHDSRRPDDLLYQLGRHIFQAAWHEDQRLGVMLATHFGLPQFRQAVELLYLCLSGELCELRSAVDAYVLRFFEQVYAQPAIRDFLTMLQRLNGGELNDIPQQAQQLFARLAKAFSRFLNQPAQWAPASRAVPLYKLVFANYSRLPLLAAALGQQEEVKEAANLLNEEARRIIDQIVHRDSAADATAAEVFAQ
jgi:hypothetical protein